MTTMNPSTNEHETPPRTTGRHTRAPAANLRQPCSSAMMGVVLRLAQQELAVQRGTTVYTLWRQDVVDIVWGFMDILIFLPVVVTDVATVPLRVPLYIWLCNIGTPICGVCRLQEEEFDIALGKLRR